MEVVFDHAEDVARGIKTFWFKPEHPVSYVAGQFIELYLPHYEPDSRGTRRWFTLSSSPTEPMLSITTKFAPTSTAQGTSLYSGGSSFKRTLLGLEPGTSMRMADPMGDFVLPKDPTIPLVFVAAGIGITPVRSIIKWLQDTDEQRNIQLIYAVSHNDQIAFEALFQKYDLSLTTIVGHLGSNKILQITKPTIQTLIYLSGPEPMIEAYFKELPSLGINANQLVTDYFHGYSSV